MTLGTVLALSHRQRRYDCSADCLEAGKLMLAALEKRARVDCGYAALSNLHKLGEYDDRMDSFFLAETLKYLYLLFEDARALGVDMDAYELNTEAHLLPLLRSEKRESRCVHSVSLVTLWVLRRPP